MTINEKRINDTLSYNIFVTYLHTCVEKYWCKLWIVVENKKEKGKKGA